MEVMEVNNLKYKKHDIYTVNLIAILPDGPIVDSTHVNSGTTLSQRPGIDPQPLHFFIFFCLFD